LKISECNHFFDGQCALGLFDGKPNESDCASCESYEGKLRGLGDAVNVLAKNTGMSAIAKTLSKATGKPCNCNKRRVLLNDKFKFKD